MPLEIEKQQPADEDEQKEELIIMTKQLQICNTQTLSVSSSTKYLY